MKIQANYQLSIYENSRLSFLKQDEVIKYNICVQLAKEIIKTIPIESKYLEREKVEYTSEFYYLTKDQFQNLKSKIFLLRRKLESYPPELNENLKQIFDIITK